MEENNNLQDILLDRNDDEKSRKLRKALIGIATLVILFVVILIIMKLLNGPSNDTNEITNNQNLILPSEPQLKVEPQTGINNEIFEQVPIASDTKENFEAIVNDYKNAQLGNNNATAPALSKPLEPQANEAAKLGDITPKQKAEQPKKVEPKKTIPKQEVAKSIPQKGATKQIPAGKYIQVASLSKFSPNNPLIKKIESNGLNYHIYETTVNGKNVIKVLIGPFNDNDIAPSMDKIKQNISNGAFIYRIK